MDTRTDLHALVDELPDCDLEMAHDLIMHRHALREDPLLLALVTAPPDDEPDTSEERAASDDGWKEYQQGEFFTAEQARRALLS